MKKEDGNNGLTDARKKRLVELSDTISAAVLEILNKEEPLSMNEGLAAMAASTISILNELADVAGAEKNWFKARYCVSLLQ